MNNTDFIHLHAHGEFSQLDAVGQISHVVQSAKGKGFTALAQTEHGNVSGAIKFYKECNKQGIKPIIGCEIYCVDDPSWRKPDGVKEKEERYHLIVLAKNWNGFVSLERLLTKAHSNVGFYYKPRVSWEDAYQLKDCIVTTACVGGPLKHPQYEKIVSKFNEAYGSDFYLELQPHDMDIQVQNNIRALDMAKKFSRKIVITNDFHYANASEYFAQEALLGLRRKETISSDNKWDFTPDLWMKTYSEMIDTFKTLNRRQPHMTDELIHMGLLETVAIAEQCNFKLPKLEVDLPDVDTSELGTLDPDTALAKLCEKGWEQRFETKKVSGREQYLERMCHELQLIKQLNFAKYFLIVWDLYAFCQKQGIAYGPGRGSGAGSLVCYLLGITSADPLQYGLIFERFINPERIDLPDLDLDFEHNRRDEVYKYLQSKYNVAHIKTFHGMNTKMVLKDVSRFKEIDHDEINEVCKEIGFHTPKEEQATLKITTCEQHPERYPLFHAFAKKYPTVIDISKVLEGQVRQAGIHAGGVIVSRPKLEERVALEYCKGDISINFDMYDVQDLGLLKLDVLGSKTVSVLDMSKRLIEEKTERELNFEKLELNDTRTLENFNKAFTIGIFQFESDGIRDMLKKMAPHTIDTLITANAMYRPGPLQFKDIYIKNKRNPDLIKPTKNAALNKITAETYGVFIYQEQVMKIAVEVAGYTYPQADALRKDISKSKGKEAVEKHRAKFVEGSMQCGKLTNEFASHIFDQIVDFGRYAFNKSHATTYTLISYYAMWLKTHFPCEFITAQIAYSDDKDQRWLLRQEANRLNISYKQPDINHSDRLCRVEKNGNGADCLRGGLLEIDGVGTAVVDVVLDTRANEPFKNFNEFLQRLENKRVVNIAAQERLLNSGACGSIIKLVDAQKLAKELRSQSKTSKPKKIQQPHIL